MQLILSRYSDNGDSTLGLLFQAIAQDFVLEAYTIEDEARVIKVPGETCIPAGLYEVKKRKEDTPLTKKYQDKYKWFDYHLELQGVEGFKSIYIHVGNTEKHTDGCILVGETANLNTQTKGFIGGSALAYERIYADVSSALLNKDKVFIEIRDVKAMK